MTAYYHLQSSTWNEQGAPGDPGVLQSESQPDGVWWRVSEGSGSVWAGAGEPLLFSPFVGLTQSSCSPPLLPDQFPKPVSSVGKPPSLPETYSVAELAL